MANPAYRFPRRFDWGVAAAAVQIEGAADVDGRGESIWDRFARKAGAVANGDTPAVACDHYRRFRADLDLMRKYGVRNYRLSIGWPRLYPTGHGELNQRGLDFYQRLIDAMLEREITPWVTLYHWDLPQTLEDEGGWRVRSTVDAFARYADTVVRALGDRVKRWVTVNEIPCFIGMGYGSGVHAPGAREDRRVLAQANHHALLAHGHALRAVREHGGRGARAGMAHNPDIAIPVIEGRDDIAAAERWMEQRNAHLLAPLYTGRYPTAYLRSLGRDRPKIAPGDLELIAQPADFLGLNVYTGMFVRAGRRGAPEVLSVPPHYPMAGLPWLHIAPQAIYWAMRHLHSLYRVPSFYITENGVGYEEQPDANGAIIDLHRREYLRNYLIAVHRARTEGIPVGGYFLWSFIDNFEWSYGYAKRFGIVYNDFATQRRTPKLSARWYAEVMRENRIV